MLDRSIEIDAPRFVQFQKRESRERLGNAGYAKARLAGYGHSMLEIGVPQILCEYCFSAEHDDGAQANIALSSLDIGKRVSHRRLAIATGGQFVVRLRRG